MKKCIKFLSVVTLLSTIVLSMFPTPVSVKAETQSKVDSLIADMSTQEKITQLIMTDFRSFRQEGGQLVPFTEMNDEIANLIDKYDFGGVILFAENVQGTEQTANLTYELQEAALKDNNGAGNSIPMFIATDQEGGIVYRLGSGTALPGNMAVGATRSTENSRNVGKIIGSELSALGINVDLAPVLDVNNNPKNPVIGVRSYSEDPELVAELGVANVQGLQGYNVSGAAKHFPGHGDTETDSHYGLPQVDKSLDELKQGELVPFQAAMDEGIDMVMTAHILFPQLDSDYPATLSKNILTDLVRNDMGYKGLIITDSMTMQAITNNFGEIGAVKQAIYAGVDILLKPTFFNNKADAEKKLDAIVSETTKEAENNPEFMDRLNESVKRVLSLKEKRGLLDYEENKPSKEAFISNASKIVGSEENRKIEREISREAVTVVKNEDDVLPFRPKSGEKVLLVGANENQFPGMEFSLRRLKNEGVIPNDAEYESVLLNNGDNIRNKEEVDQLLEGSNYVVVISQVGNETNMNPNNSWLTSAPMMFTKEAKEMDIPSVIMSVSNPYDVTNYPDAKGILAVYGAKGMDPTEGPVPTAAFGPNIPAGIEIIFGKAPATGKLPVSIPVLNDNYEMTSEVKYPFGYGLTLDEIKEVEAIALNVTGIKTLKKGSDLQLETTVTPSDANIGTLTYESNRPEIATVDETGLVTGVKDGTAKITVTTENGKTASFTLRVTK